MVQSQARLDHSLSLDAELPHYMWDGPRVSHMHRMQIPQLDDEISTYVCFCYSEHFDVNVLNMSMKRGIWLVATFLIKLACELMFSKKIIYCICMEPGIGELYPRVLHGRILHMLGGRTIQGASYCLITQRN